MRELYELKDKLCDELKEYGKKDLSNGTLDVVDKLTHTIKNLDKIIENYDGGYSGRYPRGRMHSNEGYSYHGDMITELKGLMKDAPDERTRQEFHRFIQKMETM